MFPYAIAVPMLGVGGKFAKWCLIVGLGASYQQAARQAFWILAKLSQLTSAALLSDADSIS